MYIVKRKQPNSTKYVWTDNPHKTDKVIVRTRKITDLFWNTHRNTDEAIRSRLNLPKDMMHIVKTVTDAYLRDMLKGSDYQKHQTRYETNNIEI